MTPERLAELVLARPSRCGTTRLVCVDGPAGSGKTTLAADLAAAVEARGRTVAVVHLDDLLEGWDGLDEVGRSAQVLLVEPWAAGVPGGYRRYDWHRAAFAEHHEVPPADVAVLEGVGSGHPGFADLVTLLVWVEAPDELRIARGLERDGPELVPQWRRWLGAEQRLHARERTRERADVLVDGTGPSVPGL
ncbi:MAG TPA: 4-amino-4-deoxy-L-arabinose transferase [Marmoricola sp.]|nr:4-amino-4-deoxy-L-arabinose transferase [Marmoricola sp.]